MSGRSTPKRPFGVGDDNLQNVDNEFSAKRHRAEANQSSLSGLSFSSLALYGTSQNITSPSHSIQHMEAPGNVDRGHIGSHYPPLLPGGRLIHSASPSQTSSRLSKHESDVQMTGIEQEEEVCFGMLRGIPIQITKIQDVTSITFEDVGREKSIFLALSLDFQDDRCLAQTEGGISVATLNTRTHLALKSLSSASSLRYRGIVRQDEFKRKLIAVAQPVGHTPQDITGFMSILIFGVPSMGAVLARELSRKRLFLQHPDPLSQHCPYSNPQYLNLVASSLPNGAVLPPITSAAFQPSEEAHLATQEVDDGADDVITILNNLPQQDYLGEADIDERVKTPLLGYQREAVHFTLHREATTSSKPGSLWRPEHIKSGPPVYRHIITRSKSPVAHDIRGGILADDMGLGKTLSIIATIVSTIAASESHALTKPKNEQEHNTSLTPCKSTLVIVPSALLLDGWIDEIEKHVVPGFLKYYKYHGPDRKLDLSSSLPYHIVFSTYETVASDLRRGGGVLTYFYWYRLVLDEAHTIRNWSTGQFKAMKALSAAIRWCITGTPIQNSLDDLESLIRFLRIPDLEIPATFHRHIADPTQRTGMKMPNFKNLKLLLGSICLRRSRMVLSLPGVTASEHRLSLSEAERRGYKHLTLVFKDAIDAAVSKRRKKRGNLAILDALLKMRIFCNLGLRMEVSVDSSEPSQPDEVLSLFQQSGEAVCAGCKVEILALDRGYSSNIFSSLDQGHFFCPECASNDNGAAKGLTSLDPKTDDDYSADHLSGSGNFASILNRNAYPSKMMALLSDIKENGSQDKSIVFSCWRRSLDLVCQLFRQEGITFSRVDGEIHPSQRKKILAQFYGDPEIRVLLMTLGTGAVGLNNLSVANRIHILEPQWNPSIENQAIGRVLRIGQDKHVSVIRYITEGTIEENVAFRQIVKTQLALKGIPHPSGKGYLDTEQNQLRALRKIIGSPILVGDAPNLQVEE